MTPTLNEMLDNLLGNSDPVVDRCSYTLHNPGIPFTTLVNAIILLLDAYGVKHTLTRDINDMGTMETGNAQRDEIFRVEYLSFKMFLDGLIRTHNSVECSVQGSTAHVYMTFSCR